MLRYPLAKDFRQHNHLHVKIRKLFIRCKFTVSSNRIRTLTVSIQYFLGAPFLQSFSVIITHNVSFLELNLHLYAYVQDYCVKALQDGEIIGVAPGGSTEAIMAEVSCFRWQYWDNHGRI